MSVECHFVGQAQPLIGGQEFLENLLAATSAYAQGMLSGIPHPSPFGAFPPVSWQKVEPDQHRLVVRQKLDQPQDSSGNPPGPLEFNLPTLQFFDLVEALDQLCADPQTLPDLTMTLTPVPRRETKPEQPIAKRVVPAAVGLSGLAVAAIAFFYIPVPEVRIPEPEPTSQESPESPAAGESPTPTAPPPDDETSEGDTDGTSSETTTDPEAASSAPETTEESSDNEAPDTDAVADSETSDSETEGVAQAEAELDALLNNAPLITDADEIEALTQDVRQNISAAWNREHTFDEDAIFRAGVAENGDILGFRQANQTATDYVDETPMLELLYIPVGENNRIDEPMVEMRIVFTPDGVVQVSPWHGWPDEDE
jgi:hypothetical protein